MPFDPEAPAPWPETEAEFLAYVKSAIEHPHDYNTSAAALGLIAQAAFNYGAGQMGNSGFQAGWAGLSFMRGVRSLKGPFAILSADQFMYPQYGTAAEKVTEYEASWAPWMKERAQELIDESRSGVHPGVMAHWQSLANTNPEPYLEPPVVESGPTVHSRAAILMDDEEQLQAETRALPSASLLLADRYTPDLLIRIQAAEQGTLPEPS